MNNRQSLLLAAGVSLALAATAQAGTIVFTNEAEFLAHTQPGFFHETFTSLPDRDNHSPLNFSNNGFAYKVVGEAVPEPSSLALALMGAFLSVFAGFWSRRRESGARPPARRSSHEGKTWTSSTCRCSTT